MNINDLLCLDKNGLYFLDTDYIKLNRVTFPEYGKKIENRREFYIIEGINDYIIKSCIGEPIFFNTRTNLKLLKKLVDKQSLLPDIGFPIGYSIKKGSVNGTVIPFYKDAISLNRLFHSYSYDDLKKFYNHIDDDIDNLIQLFVDILKLLRRMYEKDVMYTDIRSGNFVLYKNEVKVIDFDPGCIDFKDRGEFNRNIILINYCSFVQKILREKFHYEHVFLPRGEDFIETECQVKMLNKSLRR